MKKTLELWYSSSKIETDKDGNVSLTDLWKASGCIPNKEVKDWIRLGSTESYIKSASRFLKVENSHLIKIKRGKGGGTFAHPHVAIEYAQYLSTDLAVFINNVFFERVEEEKNPQLAVDRAVDTWKRQGKSDKWIDERLKSKAAR